MLVRRKPNEIFVTGLDDRELTEVRRLSRPGLTKVERRNGLADFLSRNGVTVAEDEEIYVWA